MFSILADAMQIATRTEPLDHRDADTRYRQSRKDERRRKVQQLNQAFYHTKW